MTANKTAAAVVTQIEIKKANLGQDFLLIKGLKIQGFKGHQENPKDVKSYRELEPDEINTRIKERIKPPIQPEKIRRTVSTRIIKESFPLFIPIAL